MEGISDIKIVGIDEKRPPRIRKEPYIDLYFKLSHKAPVDWCNDFNALMSKHPFMPKIKEQEGLYIEAWVRKVDDIAPFFVVLKKKVDECSQYYIERIEATARQKSDADDASEQDSGEQGRLNRIIAELEFDSVEP